MTRHYPDRPLLGVGALILDGENILLCQRGKPPFQHYWSLPGGLVELGERVVDALIREVKEETGLDVATDQVAEVFERITPDAQGRIEYHYVMVDYLCRVTGGRLQSGDDAQQVQWFARHQLPQLLLTPGTLDVIERTFDYAGK